MARSSGADDFDRLRLAMGRVASGEVRPPALGSPGFVGTVTSSASAIGVGRFLLVEPTYVLGPEIEGGTGTLSVNAGDSIPVFLLGPSAAATGDQLVCRFVDHRWVAERSAGGGVAGPPAITIPACFCPVPASLTMTSVYPACNYGMFQSCSIVYQPTPAWAADLGLGPNIFLSNEPFVDTIANASFYYYLYCQYNQFSLTRLYPTSPYGSPYRDALLYSWVLGGYGNTCNPFRLDGGRPYIGSDQTCLVQIDPA